MLAVGASVALAVVAATVLAVRAGDDGDGGAVRPPAEGPPGLEPSVPGVAEVGTVAPPFSLDGLDGGQVALADFAGRPVVVNFWASWCAPCRQEFPLLADALRRHAGDDLVVVGVTYRDLRGDARSFARDQGAGWPLAYDPPERRDVARAYGVRAIPQTFFVDRDGVIRERVFGLTSAAELEEHLGTVLG